MSIELPKPIIKRSKRKTISVEISESAEIIVRAPRWLSERKIIHFVKQHTDWLENQYSERLKKYQPRYFNEGEIFYFLGNQYILYYIDTQLHPIHLECDGQLCAIGFYVHTLHKPRAEHVFKRWYKQQATKHFLPRLQYWSQQMDLSYKKWRLSEAQTRWGVCNSDGTIGLNWRLIMAPEKIIDYVIIHELAHLAEMNHGPSFWRIVKQFDPDYKKHIHWLKQHSYTLRW